MTTVDPIAADRTSQHQVPAANGTLSPPPAENPIKKFSFNLYLTDIGMLKELAALAGSNVTMALRSAIATEYFLRTAAKRGESIFLESPDGQRREIVFR